MTMWDDISFDDTSTSTPAPEVSTGGSSWYDDYLGLSGGTPANLSLSADDFYGDLFESIELAQKILRRPGSLRIEVGPSFFENLRSDDWPR